jgi:hypothetical protein
MSVTSPYNPAAGDRRNGAPSGPTATTGPAPAATGDRLPKPPRRRRPGFAALAVLLVVGAAATAGLLAIRLDERVPILVAATDIPVGKEITRQDLAVARVASSELKLIAAEDVAAVEGRYATQSIPAGRPLDAQMLGDSGLLKPGWVALGVVIKPGNVPATGLQSGDRVKVYKAVDGAGTLLTNDAIVSSVSSDEGGGGAFGGGGNGDSTATIIVQEEGDLTAQIAAASLAGQIVLGLTERGGGTTG